MDRPRRKPVAYAAQPPAAEQRTPQAAAERPSSLRPPSPPAHHLAPASYAVPASPPSGHLAPPPPIRAWHSQHDDGAPPSGEDGLEREPAAVGTGRTPQSAGKHSSAPLPGAPAHRISTSVVRKPVSRDNQATQPHQQHSHLSQHAQHQQYQPQNERRPLSDRAAIRGQSEPAPAASSSGTTKSGVATIGVSIPFLRKLHLDNAAGEQAAVAAKASLLAREEPAFAAASPEHHSGMLKRSLTLREMQRTARERLIQKSVVGKDLQQQTDEAHAQPPSPYLARQSPPSPASQHQQQLQPERAATVSSGRTSRSPLLTSAAQLPAGAASKAKPPPPPPHSAQSSLGAGSSSAGSLKTPQQQPEPSLAPASRPASSLSTTEWQIRVMSLQSEIETLRKDKIALESQLRQLGHQPVTSLKSSPSPDPHSSVAQTGEQPQTDATPAESTGPDKASSGTPGEQAPEGASSAGQVWKEIKTLSTAIMQKLGVEQQSVAVLPKQPPDQTPAPIQPVDSSLAPVDTDETAKQQEARPASTTADSQVASPSQLPTSQPSIVAREQHTPSLSDKAAPAKPTVARKPASLSGTSASTTSSGNSKLPFAHQHSTAASLASQTTTAAPSSTPSPAQTSAPASAPAPAPAQAPTSVVPVADTTARIPDLPKKPAPSLNAAKAAADDLPKKRTEPAVSSNAVLPKDDPVDLGTEFKSDLLNIMGSFGF